MGWKKISHKRHHDDRQEHKAELKVRREQEQADMLAMMKRLPGHICGVP